MTLLDLGALATKKAPDSAFADVTATNFEAAVLTASLTKPVIVQFWAPWCGPCKQLKPLLEGALAAANGAVDMVRVNIDDAPDLAQALRVQSVPMVYAFFQGQPVDGFVGLKPESELKNFIAKLVKLAGTAAPASEGGVDEEALAKLMQQGHDHLAADNITDALASYSTAFDIAPDRIASLAGIGWCFVAQKDSEAFDALLEDLTPEQLADPALTGLVYLRDLRQRVAATTAVTGSEAAKQFATAEKQLASFDLEDGIETLAVMLKKHRDWQDGQAQKSLLSFIDALGPTHPLTRVARRKMSSVLFA